MKITGHYMEIHMKGAWVMHTLRSVINDDKVWFEILKEFMEENAKGFADTMDFFNKVSEKTGQNYWYFRTIFLHSKSTYSRILSDR